MRSSVLPVANVILDVSFESGDRARQRMEDEWALKRNVSVKSTFGLSVSGVDASSCPVKRLLGMDAANPCRTLS